MTAGLVSASLDARRLKRKFEAVDEAVSQAVSRAMGQGYAAVIDSTPQDTGFLRASWYQTIGGVPTTHPNPPDSSLKAKLRYGSGPQPAFTGVYGTAIANAADAAYNAGQQVGRASNLAISKVTWRNIAPYAARVDASATESGGYVERAKFNATMAIRESLAAENFRIHTR